MDTGKSARVHNFLALREARAGQHSGVFALGGLRPLFRPSLAGYKQEKCELRPSLPRLTGIQKAAIPFTPADSDKPLASPRLFRVPSCRMPKMPMVPVLEFNV